MPNHSNCNCSIINKQNVIFFLESTSIRGFPRIARSNDRFIRWIWIIFVFITTILLGVAAYKVIIDYLQFSVNIQTFLELEDATPFPAVTVCNYQPFSKQAYAEWQSETIMSPTKFNMKMRKMAKEALLKSLNNSEEFSTLFYAMGVTWDNIDLYYQNLQSMDALKLGHNKSMIHNCMWVYESDMAFDNACEDDSWIVSTYSHHSYFNCITIKPSPKAAKDISELGLVLWLGPDENFDPQYRQGFLFDIYKQAYGLRVVIHEPDSLPDIARDGIQIEPGKMNEINYQALHYVKVNTQMKPCLADTSDLRIVDLNENYKYNYEYCFKAAIQEEIVQECGCLYCYLPRIYFPNKTLPYCGQLTNADNDDVIDVESLIQRSTCASNVMNSQSDIHHKKKESHACLPSCVIQGYESTVSVTKWRPTAWQLYWLPETYKAFIDLNEGITNNNNKELDGNSGNNNATTDEAIKKMLEYFDRQNLSYPLNTENSSSLVFNDRYTYLVVKRKGNSTKVFEERLVLTVSALFSRVGGLCSLFIGLTLAFFMEVLEFFYVICFKQRNINKSQDRKRATDDNDGDDIALQDDGDFEKGHDI